MSAAITTLKPHKGKTWILTLSNGETHFLDGEIAAQFHLHQGDLLTEEQLEQVLTAEQTRKAYQRALYLLDIRAYSYQELFQKLEATYPESVCYAVLDKLAGLNLINDARYAEALARHYVEVKHLGLRRAQYAMLQRGISKALAEEALEPYEDHMLEQCYTILTKKYSRLLTDPEDRRAIEKAKAGMARLGYDYADIQAAIDYYLEEE